MTPSFEALQKQLKKLPGVGYRSSERMAIQLLLEKPESSQSLIAALESARERVSSCPVCGNICEAEQCVICENTRRSESGQVCVVEHVSDLLSLEKSGAYNGAYHVLHGKLSPINGVGPDELNFDSLMKRIKSDSISELILALPNDIEGEATCHYLIDLLDAYPVSVSRIGFGLPSGGSVLYADAVTLQSALSARQKF
ncbi:MAG: recombination mediator RecR [Verrucomicrobiia bacterium]|jgi:recombination protein RecR